ncbi:MAG: permease [Helicobacteraceae bacterium 4484_230]|nr:MAG: permease [Helicobacteraceae bacterium 4484_230]
MHRLRRYIISSFSMLFFSIFMPLFSIASVIFLIKMAHVTSVIQITLPELLKLYLFILPELLFYTLPIAFFIAGALSLNKLSVDNEMIVFFSLGIKPGFLLRVLFTPALLLTLLLIFNFFVMFPHAKTLSYNFVTYKKSEANFNLSATEFGHNFGDWLLYIGKESVNGVYRDVVLFHKDEKEEIFIGAKKAEIINKDGVLKLKLEQGEVNSYNIDKFSQIDFKTMYINDIMKTDLDAYYNNPIDYWLNPAEREHRRKRFVTYMLFSLFPLVSLYMILSIGITYDRHQKSYIYLYLFVSMIIYFGMGSYLNKTLGLLTIPVVLSIWLGITYLLYHKKIAAKY